jgi:hypothetical protein
VVKTAGGDPTDSFALNALAGRRVFHSRIRIELEGYSKVRTRCADQTFMRLTYAGGTQPLVLRVEEDPVPFLSKLGEAAR